MNRNRIVNRPLRPDWMALALDLACEGSTGRDARERLEIRLRDTELAAVARSKVVETLHPVWLNPPAETARFTRWAIEHSPDVADLRAMNLVALMATYPFVGDVMATVGRLLRADGQVDAAQLRERLKARWGDRDAVNVAERKCILTLRWFGVLTGDRGSGISRPGERFTLTGEWAMWAIAALLLTRQIESTDALTVEAAPEFFFLDVRVPAGAAHPLLERMMSGDRRTTFAQRSEDDAGTSQTLPTETTWLSQRSEGT